MDNRNNDRADATSALPQAIEQLQEDLKPLIIKFDGSINPSAKKLNLTARCMQNEQVQQALQRIFFDLFYYLPMDARGYTYTLNMETYKDPSFSQKVHSFLISTGVDAMPDTGQVTLEDWNRFTSQLTYVMDGIPQEFPRPEPFYDEKEQEKIKETPLPEDFPESFQEKE